MTMRPIDAEAILKHSFDGYYREGDFDVFATFVPALVIENAPTIEAKPVVHAHWEKGCNDEYITIPWWTCSHCGKGALTKEETIYDQVLTEYCPYCGAQMDEVVE